MEIKTNTEYNKQLLRTVTVRNYLGNRSKIIIAAAEIALAFVLATVGVLDSFFGSAGFLFAGVFAFFIVANYFAMLGVSVLAVNKNSALGMRQCVTFGEENITVTSHVQDEEIERTVEYSEVKFVRGFSTLYVVNIEGGGAFLIDKAGLVDSTPGEFESFISSHVAGDRLKFTEQKEA